MLKCGFFRFMRESRSRPGSLELGAREALESGVGEDVSLENCQCKSPAVLMQLHSLSIHLLRDSNEIYFNSLLG